jgi:hypothetical protein
VSLLHLLSLVAIAYLPGAVLFRAPLLDPRQRAALDPEERVFWAVTLSAGWSTMLVLVLASAGRYSFGRVIVANLALSLAGLALWRGGLRYAAPAARPTLASVVPVVLVAGCVWLYGPPAEYVMGGKDPGTYMNEGIQIAQCGALVTLDPIVSTIPAALRDLFVPPHHVPSYYGLRFMGFFVLDPEAGTVVGQFPHFYPASLALGYGVGGLTGARYVTFAWAMLGLIAVYLTGARLLGRPAAAVGAALLALNVVEVWYARYPNAEVVAQALLFAAMLAWSRAQVDGIAWFGPVAASLVGMLLFVRVDMIIALGGFVAAAALGRAAGLRPVVGFFPVLVLWLAGAALYLFGVMQPYMALPVVFIANLQAWQIAALALGALVALGLLAGAARLAVTRRVLPWLSYVVIAAALAAMIYAYFFRQAGGRISELDAMAFRSFGLYLTPLGLIAAIAGYVMAVRRFLTRDPILVVTASLYGAFFFYKLRIVQEHYWLARRFLPVILPAALLLAGYALARWWPRRSPAVPDSPPPDRGVSDTPADRLPAWLPFQDVRVRMTAGVIGLVVAAIIGVAFWRQSAPVRAHVEYAGLIPRLEALAAKFTDRDLVIVESRDASDTHVLALPLAYIYARNVLVLPHRLPDPTQLAAFLDWARTKYDQIYFIGGGGTALLSRHVAVTPVGTEIFQIPEWASSRTALPREARRKEFDFSVYRFVEPAKQAATAPSDVVLDIGVNDDVNVLRFHAKERHQNGTTFRWSRDVSYISLPGVQASDRSLVLVMDDGHRPPKVAGAVVEVSMNDRALGRLEVGRDFHTYTLAIPPDVASAAAAAETPPRLKLVTNTWNPKTALGVNDDRDLGVMVDRVEIK